MEPDEKVGAYKPKVAMLIPAYNEEKVIRHNDSRGAEFRSTYPDVRIVIDDGSNDLRWRSRKKHLLSKQAAGKVLILTKPNAGKAEALNYGSNIWKAT